MSPAVDYPDELVAQQRAGIVVYHLGVLGRCYTTAEIASLVGVSRQGALRMMDNLTATVPIACVDDHWVILPTG